MPKKPMYPHVPMKKEPQFPHVTASQNPEPPFIKIGERVRYIRKGGKSRRDDWPEGAWLEYGVEGVVTEFRPASPAVIVKGERFEAIEPWAVVTLDNGGSTVIDPDEEGTHWERIGSIDLLARTEGDPISKYCCSICGYCAPEELLEEGRFLDRITWLRLHYNQKHPGKWGTSGLQPATIPVSSEYRRLLGWVDEPLPPEAF